MCYRAHGQGERRELYGRSVALALPLSARRRAPSGDGRAWRGSMRTAFIDELFELAVGNRQIMLVTGDLGFGVVTKFMTELPQQFINVGVAEQNMTGVAAGPAMSGKTAFTYSIGNFPTLRCLEQLRNA